MHRGAQIVSEPGQRELGRAQPATDGWLTLAEDGCEACLGEDDGSSEAVGSGPYDDGVRGHAQR